MSLVVVSSFAGCYNETIQIRELTEEQEQDILHKQRQDIITFARSAGCSSSTQCRFIGLGSKPCGGSWEILVYSNAIDTVKLCSLITKYNTEEYNFNEKWGIGSDCTVPNPPDSVLCIDGQCVGYWDGFPGD